MSRIRVYLVRHAKAEESAPGGDAARRLTPGGRRRFEALAEAVAGRLELRRIVTSPYARAAETAGILAAATGAPVEEEPALAPGRSTARELIDLALRAGAGTAVIGHNPELGEAVRLVAPSPPDKVRPGAVAAVDLGPGGDERLAWLEEPEEP